MPDDCAFQYLSIALGLMLVPSLTLAEGAPRVGRTCSAQEAQDAEVASVTPKTWKDFHAIFVRFGHCDDGAIAEGFSDSVGRLLAGKGGRLRELSALCAQDRSFQRFTVNHADETLSDDVIVEALMNVRKGCPPGRDDLCRDLEFKLEQSGGAQASPASPGFRRIQKAAPGVTWSPPIAVDVDGDGVPDVVALGRTAERAVVGVARNAASGAKVFRLPPANTSEGAGCGPPSAARVVVESPPWSDDADAPAAAKTRAALAGQPFCVELGDCDAFHFYFDGAEVSEWRR